MMFLDPSKQCIGNGCGPCSQHMSSQVVTLFSFFKSKFLEKCWKLFRKGYSRTEGKPQRIHCHAPLNSAHVASPGASVAEEGAFAPIHHEPTCAHTWPPPRSPELQCSILWALYWDKFTVISTVHTNFDVMLPFLCSSVFPPLGSLG